MGNVGPSSAIVSIDPGNGDIVAMASSAQYGKSKFNLAAQGHRQPGSSFKIMALLTALREGVNPNSTTLRLEVADEDRRPAVRLCGAPLEIKTYSARGGGSMNLVSRDARLRQLRLHPARPPTSARTRSRRPRG